MAAIYFFDDYRVDSAGRRLWRGDQTVAVPGKAFECIVYLVEHRDRAVGRDELIAAVWGDLDTSDNVLGQTILLARKAFNDTGKDQLVIRTVPRFGYQWVLPLTSSGALLEAIEQPPETLPQGQEISEDGTDSAVTGNPATELMTRPRRKSRILAALLVSVVIFFGCSTWIAIEARRKPDAMVPQGRGLTLVLPVTTASSSEPVGWIRLGVMDLIGEKLRAAGMAVVPSDNVVALVHDDATRDLKALANATHAGLIVETGVEQVGERWRVRIATHGRAQEVSISAESDDVLDAATLAAHRLASGLGLVAGQDPTPSVDRAQQALVKRMDAALLAGNLAEVGRLFRTAAPELQSLPAVQLRMARFFYQRGDWDQAQARLTALASRDKDEKEGELRARALTGLGAIALAKNDFSRAFDYFNGAVNLLGDERSPWLGNALNGRAASLAAQRLYAPALADFARARVALEQSGDRMALAVLDGNLASLALSRDDLHEAVLAYARVGEIFRTYSAPAFELDARINSMLANLLLLNLNAARDDGARITELAPSESNPSRRLRGALAQYELLLRTGALTDADVLLTRISKDAAGLQDDELSHDIDLLAGERAMMLGRIDVARRFAESAALRADNSNDPRGRARTAWLLVRTRIASTDLAGAETAAKGLDAWAAQDKLPVAHIYAGLAAAQIALARNEPLQTNRYLGDALEAAEGEHVPSDLVTVAIACVDHDILRGDTSRLAGLAQRMQPWATDNHEVLLAQARAYRALGWTTASQTAQSRADALPGLTHSP